MEIKLNCLCHKVMGGKIIKSFHITRSKNYSSILYSGENIELKLSSSVLELTTECRLFNMARYNVDFKNDLCVGPVINQLTQISSRKGLILIKLVHGQMKTLLS